MRISKKVLCAGAVIVFGTALEASAQTSAAKIRACVLPSGNARIVAANGNPVAALLPLHPDRVRPLPERVGGRLAYEYFSRRGARQVLLQEEVLHLRGLSLAEDGVI